MSGTGAYSHSVLDLLQEYSQHVADSAELSESLVSSAAEISAVTKHSRVPSSSHEDPDEPACSMEDVIQLLQLLSAIASDTQSTGVCHLTSYYPTVPIGSAGYIVYCLLLCFFVCKIFCQRYLGHGLMQGDEMWQGRRPGGSRSSPLLVNFGLGGMGTFGLMCCPVKIINGRLWAGAAVTYL